MSGKDIAEKNLEAYNDVFADIVNGLLFDGKPIVTEEALTDAQPYSMYKADGNLHEQERDVSKYWNDCPVRIALLGLENQTDVDRDMPLRVISYDGAAYRTQLSGAERYPVITLVLYFGERRWKNCALSDCVTVPEALIPYFSDYRVNIFEIAYLTDEQIDHFHSDFRIVADYFAHWRVDRDYRPGNPRKFDHQNEILKLMSAISHDQRFSDTIDPKGGTPKNMCEVLDRVEQKGIRQGMQQGMQKGMQQGMQKGITIGELNKAKATAFRLRDLRIVDTPGAIAHIVGVETQQVEQWFAENPM